MLDSYASSNRVLLSKACSTKRKLNKNFAILWHKCLYHISKQRIQILVSDGILDSLDLSKLEVRVKCIKEKQTNIRKLGANKCSNILELIHTDICGPFFTTSWNGQQYFITFMLGLMP